MKHRGSAGSLADKFGVCYPQDSYGSVPLINSAYITGNDGGVSMRSVDTSPQPKIAEYIAGLMIENIGSIGNTNVVLAVADTCATVAKAWPYELEEFP